MLKQEYLWLNCVLYAIVLIQIVGALQVGLTAIDGPANRPSDFRMRLLQSQKRDANPTTLANEGSDTLYLAPINLDGTTYNVQVDTGSSDLWVIDSTPGASTNAFKSSSGQPISVNITYGTGWAAGDIESASTMTFSGVALQSVPYISASAYDNLVTSFKGTGILGLGFESMSMIRSGLGSQAKGVLTWIQSYFQANPNEAPYITVKLSRSVDSNGESGTLTLSEIMDQYSAISNVPKIATYPQQNPARWNVLVDGIYDHNGKSVSLTSNQITSEPDGKTSASGNMVSLLDTGATAVWLPADVINALYGSVPGANFNKGNNMWYAPCGTRIYFTVKIGNQYIPIDPDDVLSTGSPGNECSAIWRQQFLGAGFGFDALLGGAFLKSTYALFHFGDQTSPYVQLLPISTEKNPQMAGYFQSSSTTGTQATSATSAIRGAATPSGSSAADLTSTPSGKKHSAVVGVVAVLLFLLIAGIVCFTYWLRRDKSKAKKANVSSSLWSKINAFVLGQKLQLPSSAGTSIRSSSPDVKQALPIWEQPKWSRSRHMHTASEPANLLYGSPAKTQAKVRPSSFLPGSSGLYPTVLPTGYSMQSPASGRPYSAQYASRDRLAPATPAEPESPTPIGKVKADGRISMIAPLSPIPIAVLKRDTPKRKDEANREQETKAETSTVPRLDIIGATPTTATRDMLLSPDLMPSRVRLTPVAPGSPDSSRRTHQRISAPEPRSPAFDRSAMPIPNRQRHSHLYIPTGQESGSARDTNGSPRTQRPSSSPSSPMRARP